MKPIDEEYWKDYEEKRLKNYSERPSMPKILPNVKKKTIYDPPWLWDEENQKYTPNVLNFFRALIEGKPKNIYDGEIK